MNRIHQNQPVHQRWSGDNRQQLDGKSHQAVAFPLAVAKRSAIVVAVEQQQLVSAISDKSALNGIGRELDRYSRSAHQSVCDANLSRCRVCLLSAGVNQSMIPIEEKTGLHRNQNL